MKTRNRWKSMILTAGEKLAAFTNNPSATLYFISIIIAAGGVGVWLPIINGESFSFNNATTYVFALLSAMLADYLIKKMILTTPIFQC